MFTGIIEDIGVISNIHRMSGRSQLTVKTALQAATIREGDSIAVDGVCLTVVKTGSGIFSADASLETLTLTTLKEKRVGERVNLERAMSAESRFGGHLVTGHVDGTGTILELGGSGDSTRLVIDLASGLARYIVKKGSVAIDGISLTVNEQRDNTFTVNIIPYTISRTTIGEKNLRDVVNIETDIIGKYVESFLMKDKDKGIDRDFLYRHGFIQGE
ncbi:MAG TPA: riboflavin synthase [Syntrophorhabdaceae bacterium]|nr:riboflavin synthase [Syntrophorhabdaceae bacterium]